MIVPIYHTPSLRPGENDRVAEFVSSMIWGSPRSFGPHSSMGVYDDGALIAGSVYHNWDEDAGVLEISSASRSRRWLQPRVIRAMFEFPFDLMAAQMVVLRVKSDNAVMLSIARRFGFTDHVIPRLGGRGTDIHLMTMTDDQWKSNGVAVRGKI